MSQHYGVKSSNYERKASENIPVPKKYQLPGTFSGNKFLDDARTFQMTYALPTLTFTRTFYKNKISENTQYI